MVQDDYPFIILKELGCGPATIIFLAKQYGWIGLERELVMSAQWLADEMHTQPTVIKRRMNKLAQLGYIKITYGLKGGRILVDREQKLYELFE